MEKKEPSAVDVLRYMKRLLRKGWTQGANARNATGRRVLPHSPRACLFCLHGAIWRAIYDLCATTNTWNNWPLASVVEEYVRDCANTVSIAVYNDDPKRTKAQILRTLDCAIERAAGA